MNKVIFAVFLASAGYAVYFWLKLRSGFSMMNPVMIWTDIIDKHSFFFGRFEILLQVSAIALGVMQFYPETEKKRFRISCHLPVNEYAMTGSMVFFGISVITLLWIFDAAVVYLSARVYFPYEIYSEAPVVMFYWYLTAVVIYIFVSSFTLEPVWKQKFKLGIMLGAFSGFFAVSVYNSDRTILMLSCMLAVMFIPVLFYPALRFRKGA
ncbi:hypothetical protein EP073_10335 [Geovibrio thiophilus]|uniref:ABC transporter permease n=1 Tax=Geovibrio thiophilus TaxID=139438 RepID=A0A410K027_9BACT|nr:hypothetical protein [Geovibrio thiophilus]QAR33787.1 hypothetical protein EP073_10335 [Geovibrio thiophilus]